MYINNKKNLFEEAYKKWGHGKCFNGLGLDSAMSPTLIFATPKFNIFIPKKVVSVKGTNKVFYKALQNIS